MGKSKKKKKKNNASSPVQKVERRTTNAKKAADNAISNLVSSNAHLVASLRSLKVSDRESACLALAHLFSTESANLAQAAKGLLNDGLMRALLPRLSDPKASVRLHASGALRNLTSFSDQEISDTLVKEDVITPVLSCLRTLSTSFPTLNESNQSSDQEPVWLFTEQLLAVLVNLCEESDLATRNISNGQSVQLLLDWIFRGSSQLPPQVRIPASRLLHIISDENMSLAQLVMSDTTLPNRVMALVQDVANENIDVRLSMLGFLINTCMQYTPHQLGSVVTIMPSVLKETLNRRAAVANGEVSNTELSNGSGGSVSGIKETSSTVDSNSSKSSNSSSNNNSNNSNAMEEEEISMEMPPLPMDLRTEAQVNASSPMQVAERQVRLALEIFSNVLSFVVEGDNEEQQQQQQKSNSSSEDPKTALRSGMVQWMSDQQLIDMTCFTAGIAGDQFQPDAFNTFTTHSRGMNALSSMIPLFPQNVVQHYLPLCWPRMYQTLSTMATTTNPSTSTVLKNGLKGGDHISEYVSATLLAASRFAQASTLYSLPLEFNESHSNVVQNLATNQCLSSNCRCAALSLVSAVASAPHNDATHVQLASVAVQVLQQETDLVVVAEALDVLFDMFCEDVEYRNVFVQMGMLSQLETMYPLIRQRYKLGKRDLHDLEQAVVSEAIQNLQAFIEYKKTN